MEKIKKTCTSRLNIIRLLTHKSWGLKKETLVQIYKSLIRSVIEYTGLSYYAFGKTQRKELEVIQNSAMRTIFNKKREFGTKNLLKLAGVDLLTMIGILQKNPIIVDLIENYRGVQLDEKSKGFFSGSTILNGNQFYKRILRGIDYT